jgi:hypothetical protein
MKPEDKEAYKSIAIILLACILAIMGFESINDHMTMSALKQDLISLQEEAYADNGGFDDIDDDIANNKGEQNHVEQV